MGNRFRDRYRIESARDKSCKYNTGTYFITICTRNLVHYFGDIKNAKMAFTPLGAIAEVLWQEIKNHNKHVELAEYVVMPNHVHGILKINRRTDSLNKTRRDVACRDVACNVSTGYSQKNYFMSHISPKPGTLSTIIRSYKSAVSRHARRLGLAFEWQPRFHDIIIRDAQSFKNITEYIINNPANWGKDKFCR